jgi:hydrogenase expression/formation protein HypC
MLMANHKVRVSGVVPLGTSTYAAAVAPLRACRTFRGRRLAAEVTDMCLAVPMRVKTVNGFAAVCEAKGIEREVSLFMLQGEEVAPGDHVLVHVGYAIQKVSEEDARLTWELLDEGLLRLEQAQVLGHA